MSGTLAEVRENVLRVLSEEAFGRWMQTHIPALGSTPERAWLEHRDEELLAVSRSYLDPSFS